MSRRLVRARVGAARISADTEPSEASYTRLIREQMKGIEQALSEVVRQISEATPEILAEALQPTFDKSQTYVPVKSGELKKSGYLEVRKGAAGATVEIGYARRGYPPYAVFVHELTSYQHQTPTRSKFLQAAIEEDMEAIQGRIASAYRKLVS